MKTITIRTPKAKVLELNEEAYKLATELTDRHDSREACMVLALATVTVLAAAPTVDDFVSHRDAVLTAVRDFIWKPT